MDGVISNVIDLTGDMKILNKFSVSHNYIVMKNTNPYYKDVNKALSATSTCNQFIIQKFIEKEYEINLIGVSTVNGVYIPGGIRKIRHYPTIYSPCSFGVFQSVENLNVDVHSILKLMQHVGYHGPFSVELLHKNAKNQFPS